MRPLPGQAQGGVRAEPQHPAGLRRPRLPASFRTLTLTTAATCLLLKNGFRGPIYATPATRDLCEIMLADSAAPSGPGRGCTSTGSALARARTRSSRSTRRRTSRPPSTPCARSRTSRPAGRARASRSPSTTPATSWAPPSSSSTARERLAKRLFFTGDMGRRHMPILQDPDVLHDVDVLITESTYGNRLHPSREDVKAKLADLCRPDHGRALPAADPRLQRRPHAADPLLPERTLHGGRRSGTCPSSWTARCPPRPRSSTRSIRSASTEEIAGACCASGEDPFAFPRPDLRDGDRRLEETQRHARAGRHHLGLGHVRRRPHPAPPGAHRGGRAERRPHRRLPGGEHAGPADGRAREPDQDLRRRVPAARRRWRSSTP